MIVFQLAGNNYKYPECLSEITLGKFIQYEEAVAIDKPESLQNLESIKDEDERKKYLAELSDQSITQDWLLFFVDFICFWTDAPEEEVQRIGSHEAIWMYGLINQYISNFEFDKDKTYIDFKGDKYYYPKAPINVFSKEKEYLKGTKIIEVIEAFSFEQYAEQLSKSNYGVLPFLIAILCRKENETLPLRQDEREEFINDRAQMFRELPMDEVLNFAFFLPMQRRFSKKDSSHYLSHQ